MKHGEDQARRRSLEAKADDTCSGKRGEVGSQRLAMAEKDLARLRARVAAVEATALKTGNEAAELFSGMGRRVANLEERHKSGPSAAPPLIISTLPFHSEIMNDPYGSPTSPDPDGPPSATGDNGEASVTNVCGERGLLGLRNGVRCLDGGRGVNAGAFCTRCATSAASKFNVSANCLTTSSFA